MALDTDDRRRAAMNIGSPWRGLLPLPDADPFGAGDRAHFLFLSRDVFEATGGGGILIGPNPLIGV